MEIIKCEYKGCKCEGVRKQLFKLINEEDSSVELPFCEYHFFIVMGGHFKAEFIDGKDFELIGPFKEIELIQQVIAAREMIAKLKSDKKDLKKD